MADVRPVIQAGDEWVVFEPAAHTPFADHLGSAGPARPHHSDEIRPNVFAAHVLDSRMPSRKQGGLGEKCGAP